MLRQDPRHGSIALLLSRTNVHFCDPGMTDTPSSSSSGTRLSPKAETARAERAARQAAALRANLRRRKQQARSREEMEAEAPISQPDATSSPSGPDERTAQQTSSAQNDPDNGDMPPCQ